MKLLKTTLPLNLAEAKIQQIDLASRVSLTDDFGDIKTLAGVDISCNPYSDNKIVTAAVVVLSVKDLSLLEVVSAQIDPPIPYVPGYLGFREVPAILAALEKLPQLPDLFFVDGHGYSHPRHLGVASHLGVLIDRPTIGVAKSILIGSAEELAEEAGSEGPLMWKDKVIAQLLRSRKRARPIIISSGHRISLPTALAWVKRTLQGYRLPEPTRLAHRFSNEARVRYSLGELF